MTTLEDRLKEIAEIDAKIEEKKESIEKLKGELKTQNDLAARVDPDLVKMMSESASRSRERKGEAGTVDIDESVRKAQEKIIEIDEKIKEAEEELTLWEGELEKLEGDLDNVSLGSLEQLQEDKQRLEGH
ncbi:hypothetical protein B0T19DRAFT_443176 [Cercophora scortea]|uniref:Uncharacterized protein n=1 Tax=Cercophora scortea TaxID=314031 RepID=A0AAE0IEF7_9PEZI|nr:hypothetical protein B0T19DRAFT_443176 [Cercophora scortea]